MDRSRTVLAGLLLLPFLAGCSAQPYPTESDDAAAREPVPRLLTYPTDGSDGSMEAMIQGPLRVNDRGCFALGTEVLVAPEGTQIVDGGHALVIPGIGRRELGEHVRGGGGSFTLADADFVGPERRCMPRHGYHEFVLLDPPGTQPMTGDTDSPVTTHIDVDVRPLPTDRGAVLIHGAGKAEPLSKSTRHDLAYLAEQEGIDAERLRATHRGIGEFEAVVAELESDPTYVRSGLSRSQHAGIDGWDAGETARLLEEEIADLAATYEGGELPIEVVLRDRSGAHAGSWGARAAPSVVRATRNRYADRAGAREAHRTSAPSSLAACLKPRSPKTA